MIDPQTTQLTNAYTPLLTHTHTHTHTPVHIHEKKKIYIVDEVCMDKTLLLQFNNGKEYRYIMAHYVHCFCLLANR